jgi:hypothetical protein
LDPDDYFALAQLPATELSDDRLAGQPSSQLTSHGGTTGLTSHGRTPALTSHGRTTGARSTPGPASAVMSAAHDGPRVENNVNAGPPHDLCSAPLVSASRAGLDLRRSRLAQHRHQEASCEVVMLRATIHISVLVRPGLVALPRIMHEKERQPC